MATARKTERPLRNGRSAHPHASDQSSAILDEWGGRWDPEQRYRLYRLCPCDNCAGSGKDGASRCTVCRGEGRALELVATCGTPEAVGVALVTLGLEGEWDDCPIGVLDSESEGRKWVVRPWLPSARNVSDAGKLLRRQRDIV